MASLLAQATRALPFSSKVWDLFADFTERAADSPAAVEKWYESSIRRVLLTDAAPPASFESTFADHSALAPRELLPRRYVHYLSTTAPASFQPKLLSLLSSAPSLSLSFLSSVLDPTGPALASTSSPSPSPSNRSFRHQIFERVVSHPDAGPEEWLAYAEELVRTGQVVKSQEVVRRAKGDVKLKGGEAELRRFERMWDEVCRGFEQ